MSAPALSRPSGVRGLVPAVLAILAVALAAAFVVAPWILAGAGPGGGYSDQGDLRDALRGSFTDYWTSGDRDISPGLEHVVDYWFRFHVIKGVIAALLLGVLIPLGIIVWKAFVQEGLRAGRRAALVTAGVVISGLAVFSLVAVMANIQGMVAPLSTLLPMLMSGKPDPQLSGTLDQIRQKLATDGHHPPALDVMISDFAHYHAAMAVIATIVAAVFIGVSVLLWKRFAGARPSGKRVRRVLGSYGALTALLAVATIVVAVANAETAANSAPALRAFFEGGW